MNWIEQSRIAPILQLGVSLLLGVLATAVVLILAAGLNAQPQVKAAFPPAQSSQSATIVVTYTLDDFDDRIHVEPVTYDQPRKPNDFFGNQGRWEYSGAVITDSIVCSGTFNCYLSLAYDLSSSGAEGGYWEEFSYSYTSTWPLRDLREFEQFRLRVRGDSADGFPDQFQIEFIGNDWGARAVYTITGVTTSWQCKTVTLPITGTVDWSRVKHVAIKLVGDQVTDKKGRLFFDDLALVDLDFSGDLLDLVRRQAFRYFWENRHPNTGFVRDRAVDPFYIRDVTSVAAVGFELAAFGIGAERGWISRTEAASATHQVLSSLITTTQGCEITGTSGYRGFFYHLLNIDTGLRTPDSEVSTIDTALLMAGVLFARQYYTGTDWIEIDIQDLADQLYNRVEWDWVLRTDPQPISKTNQLYMAWKPEFHDCQASNYQNCYEIPDTKSGHGYFSGELITGTTTVITPTTWDYYTDEIVLINLLVLFHRTNLDIWAWV